MAFVIAIVVMVSVWSLSAAEDGGRQRFDDKKDDSVTAIESRLEALEKLVGPTKTPVSERIDVLENGLRDLTRAMGGTGWSSVESNLREARKVLAEITKQRRDNEADLKELKELARQMEGIKDELAKFRHAMDEMGRRLKRLESRS